MAAHRLVLSFFGVAVAWEIYNLSSDSLTFDMHHKSIIFFQLLLIDCTFDSFLLAVCCLLFAWDEEERELPGQQHFGRRSEKLRKFP